MAAQTFTLANTTDITGGGITITAAAASFTQTALTSYIFCTFAGSMTVTLNQGLFVIGQEIIIADRANFPGRPGNPITIKATGSVFLIAAGNPLSQLQITKPM